MPLTRQQRRQRRRTRLTLLASALVVAAAGIAGLYYIQKNRQAAPQLDPAPRDAAIALVKQGAYEEALTAFKPYLDAGQTPPEALVAWAEARINVPLPDGAQIGQSVNALRAVLAKSPGDTQAATQLLAVLSRYPAGVENELVNLADRVLDNDPNRTDAMRARALGLASQKQHAEAARTLEGYLAQKPDDLQLQRLLLDMMRGEKQPAAAVVARAQQVRSTTQDPVLGDLVLAHAHLIDGDRDAARPLLASATQLPPGEAQRALQAVQMLDAAAVYTAVLPYLERSLEDAPSLADDPALATEVALRRFDAGRADGVLELITSGRTIDSLYMHAVHAIALHTAGQRDQAAQKIATLAEHETNRYRASAAVLQAALPTDGSALDAQAVVSAAPGLAEHGVNVAYLDAIIADAHHRLGQTDQAVAAYRGALRQRPAWAGPWLGLAELYLRGGDESQAYRCALAAGEREGRTLRVATMTARAAGARINSLTPPQLTELGELIDEVQKARPGEPATAVIRVEVLALSGQADAAAQAARTAANLTPPLNENALLQLSATARRHNLNVVDELEAVYVQRFGNTPRIAMNRATHTAVDGDANATVAAFDASVPDDAGPEWRVNRAMLYERVNHPDKLARWVEAVDSAPETGPEAARVLTRVLASPAVWSDRALADRAITRLQAAAPNAVAWRTERSRYLLTDPTLSNRDENARAAAQTVERLLAEVATGDPPLNVLVMQATARRLLGDSRGTAQLLEQALHLSPNDPGLQLEQAQALAGAGDRDRALDIARGVARISDLNPAQRRAAARLLGELGDYDAATAGLKALVTSGQATPADAMVLARLYRSQRRLDDAADLLPGILNGLTAADRNPEGAADAIVFAAGVYAAAGRESDAESALARLDGLNLSEGRRLTLRAAHEASRGRLDQAADGFAAAAAADPTNPAAWRNLVEFRLRAGQRPQALEAARAATDAGAALPGVAALHAQAAVIESLPDRPALVPLYSTLVNRDDARPAAERALQVLDRHRDDDAAQAAALQELADANPQVEAIEALTIYALRSAGQTDRALERATAATDRFPRSADLAQALAEGHAQRRNWPQTLLATDAWRARVPGGSLAADTLAAQAHRQLDRADRALEVLEPYRERIVNQPQTTPVLTRQYAILLAIAGRTQQARSMLEPMLTSSTAGTYWRMTWLDVATQGVRNTRDAGAWLQQVEGVLDESQLEERSAIAQAWWALGRRDDHPPFLERARTRLGTLASDPDANADVWFFLGTIAEHDGQSAIAAEHYRKALALAPAATNVRNNLAMVLAHTPNATAVQFDEAVALATAVTREQPDEPNFLDTLAAVLLAADRPDQALVAIQKAIDLDPGNPDWRLREDQIRAAQAE